jgi:o-succinylbenzoate---CoA ligase
MHIKEDVAIIDNDKTISYLELENIIKTISITDLKKGDIVIFNLFPDWRVIALFLAFIKNGITCSFINPKWPKAYIQSIKKNLKPKAIINEDQIDLFFQNRKKKKSSFINYKKPSTIIFSSGTTNYPKALFHSLENHYYSYLGFSKKICLSKDDRYLLSLPLWHISGLAIVFRCFFSKATLVINKDNNLFYNIVKYKISHISFVPTQVYRYLQLDIEKKIKIASLLKMALIGGSFLDFDIYQKAKKHTLPMFLSYGLSEMSGSVFIEKPKIVNGHFYYKKPLEYRTVSIKKKMLYLKGKTLFLGFLKNGKIEKKLDKDGFFSTNDLAIHCDKNGYAILGRKHNHFIKGGINIDPKIIEKHLLEIEQVTKAKIMPIKDLEYETKIIAYIKVTKAISAYKIKESLKNRLSKNMIPDEFILF